MVYNVSSIPSRSQRPGIRGKPDGRKSQASKASSAGGRNTKKSAPTPASSRKKPGTAGNADSNKEEENKEEEPPEEEKRFEASNHMEGDLVDILGAYLYDST